MRIAGGTGGQPKLYSLFGDLKPRDGLLCFSGESEWLVDRHSWVLKSVNRALVLGLPPVPATARHEGGDAR